jgi:hypothetical protein
MNILSPPFSQDAEFISNYRRPDLLPILLIMFAFIAVIVKRETRLVSVQLLSVIYQFL